MSGIGPQDLDRVLTALGEQLKAAGAKTHLVVIGGSGLLAIGVVQRPTQDPEGFSSRSLTRAYGEALRVDFASRHDQVHLKLYALATRDEPRDETDLRALSPSPDELHAAARWTRTRDAPGPFDDALAAALARFGVEDEGR